jgi:plasmid stabilization system protein ParE
MTGGIHYTPEAQQQLNELDDWITRASSAEIAQRFVSALLDHI